ncbi:MAG: cadherin repeat domain-containing protein, partial [Aequorivita sp.]|nr:cadherin repeat domain-containing protein [Aequorivita sp.]
MKFSIKKLTLRVLLVFVAILLNSCSKDSDAPNPFEITVTTSDFSKTMDENPSNGQLIGIVSGSTNEGSVTFSITEQNPAGAFSIDPASGELKVANATLFDFEINPIITGTVKVANGAVSKNALVMITLNDLVEENVFEGNINLKSQDEVNSFGANNYTRITGALFIGIGDGTGYSDIHDLTPLSTLESIDNNFLIGFNENLISTTGLENISHLGGDLNFLNNTSLTNIVGLNHITSINGTLSIYNNQSLVSLDGLNQLSSVNGYFQLHLNPLMSNIDWLENLVSVEQDFTISSCYSITNIDALSNLTTV